jgi:hypothetical protein
MGHTQMAKIKHTPTPWEVRSDPFHFDTKSDIYAGDTPVAQSIAGYPESEANAAFIVTSVNAHAELVSAARAVHRSAVPLDDEGTSFSINRKAMEKTVAVLVKLDVTKSARLPGASKPDGGAA